MHSAHGPLSFDPHPTASLCLRVRLPRSYDALRTANVCAATALVDLVAPRAHTPRGAVTDALPGAQQLPPRSPSPPPLIVFVSTMSVIPTAEAALAAQWEGAAETLVPPACAAALESGYAQSKLVAEHRLAAAARIGVVRVRIARLGLLGAPTAPSHQLARGAQLADRRDWLSLLLCAVEATGASPAGLTSGQRSVAVLPVDMAAATLAALATSSHCAPTPALMRPPTTLPLASLAGTGGGDTDVCAAVGIVHVDAAALGVAPRPLSSMLDEVEAARGPSAPPLRRELPYPAWRRLVAAAGPPAVLALAMLPSEGRGGALRLPSGARRRMRDRTVMRGRVPVCSSASASVASDGAQPCTG
jgi:hypothetical protein